MLDSKGDGKIDAIELGSLFKGLGHKFTKVLHVHHTVHALQPAWNGALCGPWCQYLCSFASTVNACLPVGVKSKVQAEVESIIWEADTDCDRCLTWKEFQEMYDRCRNDQTGTIISLSLCSPTASSGGR